MASTNVEQPHISMSDPGSPIPSAPAETGGMRPLAPATDPMSASSTATTIPSSRERPDLFQDDLPEFFGPGPRSRAFGTQSSGSHARERLHQMELERDKLRRDVEDGHAVVERLKRESELSSPPPYDSQAEIRKLRSDIAKAGARLSQTSTVGLFKAVCSTDLLFLMDTTGSMTRHIEAAKNQVRSIVNDIGTAFLKEAEVRMAVVTYRDHSNPVNIQFLDFTTSSEKVHSFLSGLTTPRNFDTPEDVLGGLQKALHASWHHRTRCIIHIADAPPHGRPLHDMEATADHYIGPGSEPHQLTHAPLFAQMVKLNINYALLRINESTDRMSYTIFQEYNKVSAGCKLHPSNKYNKNAFDQSVAASSTLNSKTRSKRSCGLLCEEHELGTTYSALQHLVLKSVTTSASRTAVRLLTSPARTGVPTEKTLDSNLMSINEEDDDEDDEESVVCETSPPQWTNPSYLDEILTVEGFSPDVVEHGASTLNDMMAHDDNIKMNIVRLTIHKRSLPFSQGALRIAYYARTAASHNNFVVKSYKRNGKMFVHLADDMRCQAMCKAFALEFNALWSQQSIDFIVPTCLKGRSRKTGRGFVDECMSIERYIEGTYMKYNNNRGYVNEDNAQDPYNKVAQAFSHFTYERSYGAFLVSDLQGVGGIFTDPAIHSRDPQRFKLSDTNLNREGFKFFFATHVCNNICTHLGLKSSKNTIMSGKLQFRDKWPNMASTVCCSNKLCGQILHRASAYRSKTEFPTYWCHTCWPQLQASKIRWICVAPGPHHEFDVSKFYVESQGQRLPRKCPEHRKADEAAIAPASPRSEMSCLAMFKGHMSSLTTPRAEPKPSMSMTSPSPAIERKAIPPATSPRSSTFDTLFPAPPIASTAILSRPNLSTSTSTPASPTNASSSRRKFMPPRHALARSSFLSLNISAPAVNLTEKPAADEPGQLTRPTSTTNLWARLKSAKRKTSQIFKEF